MMIALVQMVLYGMTTSRVVNGSQLHVALIIVMALQVQIQNHLQIQNHDSRSRSISRPRSMSLCFKLHRYA